jgi:hypothetical protein
LTDAGAIIASREDCTRGRRRHKKK